MPVPHVVAEGEYLALIALRNGFHDSRLIWDDPANAELKARRKNPNVLLAGDKLVIPDKVAGRVSVTTGKVNPFQATGDVLTLNVHFENAGAKPLASRDVTLALAGVRRGRRLRPGAGRSRRPPTARGCCIRTSPVPSATALAATQADVQILAQPADPPAAFRLLIGNLDPVDAPSGQRARLDNLGYFAGYTDADRDQLEWATEEFQCDEKLKDRGLFDDRKKNLPTWNHLGRKHGDLLPGEEVS